MANGGRGWTLKGSAKSSGTTLVLSTVSASEYPQVGDIIVVIFGFDNASTTTPTMTGLTVSSGSGAIGTPTFVQATANSASAAAAAKAGLAYAYVTTNFASNTQLTVTHNGSNTAARAAVAGAFSGVAAVSNETTGSGSGTSKSWVTPAASGGKWFLGTIADEDNAVKNIVNMQAIDTAFTTGSGAASNISVAMGYRVNADLTPAFSNLTGDWSFVAVLLVPQADATFSITTTGDATAAGGDGEFVTMQRAIYQGVWNTSDNTPYTFTNIPIGTAANDRVVVVALGSRDGYNNTGTVKVGGTELTNKVYAGIAVHLSGIHWGIIPSGDTADIEVTVSGSVKAMQVWSIEGSGTTNVTLADSDSDQQAAALPMVITPSAVGDILIGSGFDLSGGQSNWQGLTTRVRPIDQAPSNYGVGNGDAKATSTDPINVEWNYGGIAPAQVVIALHFGSASPDGTFSINTTGSATADSEASGVAFRVPATFSITTTGSADASSTTNGVVLTGTADATFAATTVGSATADGVASASLKGDATFGITAEGAATADGVASMVFRVSKTFAIDEPAGNATADGVASVALKGGATLTLVEGTATADGVASAALQGGAAFGITASGDASASGGDGELTAATNATFTADTAGAATADGVASATLTGTATFTADTAGSADASGGDGALLSARDDTLTLSTGTADASGGDGALLGGATFVGQTGTASAEGLDASLTGSATFGVETGLADAAGGSGALTGTENRTFALVTGEALADGVASASLTGSATFAPALGTADASGGAGALTSDATFGATAAGTATADGVPFVTQTGTATFTLDTGSADATGGDVSLLGGSANTFTIGPGNADASGGDGALLSPDATFGIGTGEADADGNDVALIGTVWVTMTLTVGSATASGGTGAFTGTVSATFGIDVGVADASGGTGALLGSAPATITVGTGEALADGVADASLVGGAFLSTIAAAATAEGLDVAWSGTAVFAIGTGEADASGGDGAIKVGVGLHHVDVILVGRRVSVTAEPIRPVITVDVRGRRVSVERIEI